MVMLPKTSDWIFFRLRLPLTKPMPSAALPVVSERKALSGNKLPSFGVRPASDRDPKSAVDSLHGECSQ